MPSWPPIGRIDIEDVTTLCFVLNFELRKDVAIFVTQDTERYRLCRTTDMGTIRKSSVFGNRRPQTFRLIFDVDLTRSSKTVVSVSENIQIYK